MRNKNIGDIVNYTWVKNIDITYITLAQKFLSSTTDI